MRINNSSKNRISFNFKNRIIKYIIISSIFITYSGLLLIISHKKNEFKNFIGNRLTTSRKQLIKDSLPYQFYKSGFKLNFIKNFYGSLTHNIDPIILDIKYKNYNKLLRKRNLALKKGVLITNDNDYVNAVISNEKNKLNAKIRLKGDWTDHLQSKKWSYRVQIKNDKTLFGMNKFSLQSPGTRNYISEWIFLKLLKDEGLPSLRYKFKPLIVNGENMGIYAIEEHFDKILLESNSFKEAPIIKLSESLMWDVIAEHGNWEGNNISKKSFSTGFKLNKIKNNQVLRKNFNIANQLLNGFHSGDLKTSDVFDIDKLAKYFAIVELTNTQHSSEWHNMRFYFDPFQSRLIPIGFDGDGGAFKLVNLSIEKEDFWRSKIFKDKKLTELYYKNLRRISEKSYLDNFFEKYKEDISNNKKILYKSYPAYELNKEIFYLNQKRIKERLSPVKPLNAFRNKINPKEIVLSIANNQSFPIEIVGLSSQEKAHIIELSTNLIQGIKYNQIPKYSIVEFKNSKNFIESNELFLNYKLIGSEYIYKTKVNNYPRFNYEDIVVSQKEILDNLDQNKFISIDKKNRKIIFNDGTWDIYNPFIIPPDYDVVASPGLKLNLRKNGKIISYSPLTFLGSQNEPIQISNYGGESNGIAVINAKDVSSFNYVNFLNMDNIENNKIILTGGVTIYQSPVKIFNCIFNNSYAEDSLNIVRSDFEINNTIFNESASDALDIDFSKGTINNMIIKNSFNDGLDISGSKIKVTKIAIENANDKALSIGEESKINIDKINIKDSFIGIASKDSSHTKVKFANISNTKFDFAGFQKKYEYSGSKSEIENLNKKNIDLKYLLSEGSSLIINNEKLESNKKNQEIIELFYK